MNSSIRWSDSGNFFLTKHNRWYIVLDECDQITSGIEGSANSVTSALGGYSIFVAGDDNLYSYDCSNNQVNMWSMNLTRSQPVMFMSDYCGDLFVDTNSTLYCSIQSMHHVVSKSLNDPKNTLTMVAGANCYGSASNMLSSPNGIFVDLNFTLYVADSGNNRIQRFNSSQVNAITIAGDGAPGTINLSYPVDIVLDGDGYIFIADLGYGRIIGSGPDGFRCVASCVNGGGGSASNQLSSPRSLSFDSDGNIWVADYDDRRIQKFLLSTNSRGEYNLFLSESKTSAK